MACVLEEEYEKKRRLPFHLRRRPEPEGPFTYVIRPAEERDIPDIREIYNYYVRNSVVTFDEKVWSIAQWREKFAFLRKLDLPFPLTGAQTRSIAEIEGDMAQEAPMLRLLQGWLAAATGGDEAFPQLERLGGQLPDGWVFTDVVAPVVVAPLVEEFFFRAVVLVALYTVLRRPCGKAVAGTAAVLFSSGLFVVVHGLLGDLAVDQVVSIGLLGLVCGALVMLTGRIWAAVLTHAVFNAAWVALALAGTALG